MNKFKAEKSYAFGLKFDSKAERDRYLFLRDRQNRGEISGLECQKKFTIVKPQKYGRRRVRERYYIADFVYYENGKMIVEDVKGCRKGVAYQYFTLKKALMLQEYGIWVHEV